MAILDAYRRGRISYPDIELVIKASTGEEHLSVLELSHRVYDAALRASTIDGVPFFKSWIGQILYAARADRASALYVHAPITLVLGGWDSHGGGGPLVAKLPRVLSSEIVGLDALPVMRGAVKFDALDIRKDAGPLYQSKDAGRLFEIDEEKSVDSKQQKKPSEFGFGSVPNLSERGAVITEAVQTSVVSCAAVRRLRFENEEGAFEDAWDHACQTATVALGLFGLLAQMDSGYYLRSGCDLLPLHPPKLEVIMETLEDVTVHSITAEDALEALSQTLEAAAAYGFKWRKDKIYAEADERLVTMVERSRLSERPE